MQCRMTEINNTENNDSQNTHGVNCESNCEPHLLTHEALDEQIKNFIAPLAKQLGDLAQLIEGMAQAHPLNLPQRRVPAPDMAQQARRPTCYFSHQAREKQECS